MKKCIFFLTGLLFSSTLAFSAEDILIYSNDVRLEHEDGANFSGGSGYHLYVRKKIGIESVMLVETTKDPAGKEDNYAYRALEYNPVNGDEVRYLDGKKLESNHAKFSLIDSTPEKDRVFGQAFHIFIPDEIAYGYPWSRNGIVRISRGTFINIRSFEKKYGDYSGNYADNPFMFDFGEAEVHEEEKKAVKDEKASPSAKKNAPVKNKKDDKKDLKNESKKEKPKDDESPSEKSKPKSKIVLTDDYNAVAVESFKKIADFNGGKMIYSSGVQTICKDIFDSMDALDKKENVDFVFAIDTTGSMKDDLEVLLGKWIPLLRQKKNEYGNVRFGILLYRDYGDSYNLMNLPVKKFDFTDDVDTLEKELKTVKIYGTEGGDIPEAVWEALWASMSFYEWRSEALKKIILIGDAPPHPLPRGLKKYTKESVSAMSAEKGIVIDTIVLPDDKKARGR